MTGTQNSSEMWRQYYIGRNIARDVLFRANRLVPKAFQTVMIRELKGKVFEMLQHRQTVRLLSAGSGVDFIAHHLKKFFKDRIDITLLDISKECMDINRRLFKDEFEYVVGDIFKNYPNEIDIAYNTGVLEHFPINQQVQIARNISNALSDGGHFITLNPYIGGKIYISGMERAKETGRWRFGDETPVATLSHLEAAGLRLISETPCASLSQLGFYYFKNRAVFALLLPAICFSYFHYNKSVDEYFGRKIGYYALLSVFRKDLSP